MRLIIGGVGLVVAGVLGVAVFLPMCSNKLQGQATVDGTAFVPDSCRSGQRWNFVGVELEAKDGRRLRVAATVDGGGEVVLFPAGNDRGSYLHQCADLAVERQHSKINNVTNVEGKVVLHCNGDQGTATGTIEFENCH